MTQCVQLSGFFAKVRCTCRGGYFQQLHGGHKCARCALTGRDRPHVQPPESPYNTSILAKTLGSLSSLGMSAGARACLVRRSHHMSLRLFQALLQHCQCVRPREVSASTTRRLCATTLSSRMGSDDDMSWSWSSAGDGGGKKPPSENGNSTGDKEQQRPRQATLCRWLRLAYRLLLRRQVVKDLEDAAEPPQGSSSMRVQ